MLNQSTSWQKLQAIASIVGATAITLGGIVALSQLSETRNVSRSESALSYCGLYLSNETINDFASKTAEFSHKIESQYKDIFKEGISYDEVKGRREKAEVRAEVKKLLTDLEVQRSFGQLANYFDNAISGVNSEVLDESIIRDCLSVNIICFREKYYVRLEGILDEEEYKDMMEEWREFIAKGCDFEDKEGNDKCKYPALATKEAWEENQGRQ